jgi:sulfide dehydrogenase cytochrome subunit
MRRLIPGLCFFMLLLGELSATFAMAAEDPRAEGLADACTGCHGVRGHSSGYIPSLKGLSRAQLLQALGNFRAQKGPATIMNRIMRTYSPAEIELLANYFASGTKT